MTAALDRQAAAAEWYLQLRETSNEAFMPLYFDRHRFLVLKGGGGSGKSIFAGRYVLERVTSEPGHRWLVARKVGKTLRQSCWQQLLGQIAEHYPDIPHKINRTDMTISFPATGSEILFTGLDDVEKLKSIYNVTGIWIEEASELLESDFNQLNIRLRGQSRFNKQIILTFNPISITHWLKRRFWDNPDARATVHESTYRDNRFLPEEDIETLESFRGVDDYYYSVYALGQWGVTGQTVFPAQLVQERLAALQPPAKQGAFWWDDDGRKLSGIFWQDDPAGSIRIYQEPEPGAPYVIGCDTAGAGSDWFVAQVIDNRTGVQAATLRQRTDEDLFSRQVYCLGQHYNTALIGIEANWSTHPILELERLKYPKQYVREAYDDYTHAIRRSLGWWTSSRNRNTIIAQLVRQVREDPESINDRTTLEEMLTFVRSEDWKPEAEEGAHDDTVMALAIAHAIRDQQRYTTETAAAGTVEWSADQWDDYHAASRADKEYLITLWGRPKGLPGSGQTGGGR